MNYIIRYPDQATSPQSADYLYTLIEPSIIRKPAGHPTSILDSELYFVIFRVYGQTGADVRVTNKSSKERPNINAIVKGTKCAKCWDEGLILSNSLWHSPRKQLLLTKHDLQQPRPPP